MIYSEKTKLHKYLQSLITIVKEGIQIDDTRYEKLYDVLYQFCKQKYELLIEFHSDFLEYMEVY